MMYDTGNTQYSMPHAPLSFSYWQKYGKSFAKGSHIEFTYSGSDITCTFVLSRPINTSAFNTFTSASFMLKGSSGKMADSGAFFACNDGASSLTKISDDHLGVFGESKCTYTCTNFSSYKWLFLMLGFFSFNTGQSSFSITDVLIYIE